MSVASHQMSLSHNSRQSHKSRHSHSSPRQQRQSSSNSSQHRLEPPATDPSLFKLRQNSQQHQQPSNESIESLILRASPNSPTVDYDINVTSLYEAIGNSEWENATKLCTEKKQEAGTWVVRYKRDANGNKEAGGTVLWRFLPIHSACALNPPTPFLRALLQSYPDGPRTIDDQGMHPLHYACGARATREVIYLLLMSFPQAALRCDPNGMLPLHYLAQWGPSSVGVLDMMLVATGVRGVERDKDGNSAVDLAENATYSGSGEVVKHMKEYFKNKGMMVGDGESRSGQKNDFQSNHQVTSPYLPGTNPSNNASSNSVSDVSTFKRNLVINVNNAKDKYSSFDDDITETVYNPTEGFAGGNSGSQYNNYGSSPSNNYNGGLNKFDPLPTQFETTESDGNGIEISISSHGSIGNKDNHSRHGTTNHTNFDSAAKYGTETSSGLNPYGTTNLGTDFKTSPLSKKLTSDVTSNVGNAWDNRSASSMPKNAGMSSSDNFNIVTSTNFQSVDKYRTPLSASATPTEFRHTRSYSWDETNLNQIHKTNLGPNIDVSNKFDTSFNADNDWSKSTSNLLEKNNDIISSPPGCGVWSSSLDFNINFNGEDNKVTRGTSDSTINFESILDKSSNLRSSLDKNSNLDILGNKQNLNSNLTNNGKVDFSKPDYSSTISKSTVKSYLMLSPRNTTATTTSSNRSAFPPLSPRGPSALRGTNPANISTSNNTFHQGSEFRQEVESRDPVEDSNYNEQGSRNNGAGGNDPLKFDFDAINSASAINANLASRVANPVSVSAEFSVKDDSTAKLELEKLRLEKECAENQLRQEIERLKKEKERAEAAMQLDIREIAPASGQATQVEQEKDEENKLKNEVDTLRKEKEKMEAALNRARAEIEKKSGKTQQKQPEQNETHAAAGREEEKEASESKIDQLVKEYEAMLEKEKEHIKNYQELLEEEKKATNDAKAMLDKEKLAAREFETMLEQEKEKSKSIEATLEVEKKRSSALEEQFKKLNEQMETVSKSHGEAVYCHLQEVKSLRTSLERATVELEKYSSQEDLGKKVLQEKNEMEKAMREELNNREGIWKEERQKFQEEIKVLMEKNWSAQNSEHSIKESIRAKEESWRQEREEYEKKIQLLQDEAAAANGDAAAARAAAANNDDASSIGSHSNAVSYNSSMSTNARAEMQMQLDNAVKEAEDMRKFNAVIRKEHNATIAELENELENERSGKTQLLSQVVDLQYKVASLQDELDDSKKSSGRDHQHSDELLFKMKRELESERSGKTELLSKIVDLQYKITSLQEDLEDSKDSGRDRLSDTQTIVAEFREKERSYLEQLNAAQNNVISLENRLFESQYKGASLHDKEYSSQHQLNEMRQKENSYRKQISEALSKEKIYLEKEKTYLQQLEEAKEHEQLLHSYRQQLQEAIEKQQALEEKEVFYLKQICESKNQFQTLPNNSDENSQRLWEQENALREKENEFKKKQRALEEKEDSYLKQIREAKKQIQTLQDQNEDQSQKLWEAKKQQELALQEKEDELNKKLREVKKQQEMMLQEIEDSCRKQLRELKKTQEQESREKEQSFNRQLQDVKKELDEAVREKEELQEKLLEQIGAVRLNSFEENGFDGIAMKEKEESFIKKLEEAQLHEQQVVAELQTEIEKLRNSDNQLIADELELQLKECKKDLERQRRRHKSELNKLNNTLELQKSKEKRLQSHIESMEAQITKMVSDYESRLEDACYANMRSHR